MVVTFLPYPNFKKSIECLDDSRCGKQRVEAYQLINAIMKKRDLEKKRIEESNEVAKRSETSKEIKIAWINHPACQMWIGYENALILYYNTCLDVWEKRGKANSMERFKYIDNNGVEMPWWFGWYEFHESHKASLQRKHPYFYDKKFTVHEYFQNRGYVWPSHFDVSIRKKLEMYPRQCFDRIQLLNRTHYSKDLAISSYVIQDYDVKICKRNELCEKYKIFAEINKDTMRSASNSKYLLYTITDLKKICNQKLTPKQLHEIKKFKKKELFDYCEKHNVITV
jgi:hypothetical protein